MDEFLLPPNDINQIINRIAQASVNAQDLNELFREIHGALAQVMPARNFYISLYDAEADLFNIAYVADEFNDSWAPYKPGKGLGGYILRTGQPVLTTPEVFAEMERAGQVEILSRRMVDYAGVPLRTRQGVIGIMAVQTYHLDERLSQADLTILDFFSTQVAAAIERKQFEQRLIESAAQNKRLRQQVQEYAAELEQRIAERTAQLEAANKELEAFSYSVSHDLRAPLRAISGYTRLLQLDHTQSLNPEGQELLNRVSDTAQRMNQLIDDLLRLSRLSRQELQRQWVDLSALAHKALDQLGEREPGRLVAAQVSPGLSAICDPNLIQVVLENLLGNAWKFTSRVQSARIEFGVTEDESGRLFFVRDNGAGFDMRYADRLFAPFQRLHRADEFEGNGVGLATVLRIIQRHGGKIWAEGKVNQGAIFYFTLPGGPA